MSLSRQAWIKIADCFFEVCAPFLVVDWDTLVSKFPKGHRGKLAYVLHLILKSANESELPIAEIEEATIESSYEENKELCTSFELAKDNFTHGWQAVYHISTPELKGTVSVKLVDTIRFYRQHVVSGLRLLANYCQFNKYRPLLDKSFNPWLEFQLAVKGKQNSAGGIGITEAAFDRIENIKNERPSDVIRAALYPFPKLFGQRPDFNTTADLNAPPSCNSLSNWPGMHLRS